MKTNSTENEAQRSLAQQDLPSGSPTVRPDADALRQQSDLLCTTLARVGDAVIGVDTEGQVVCMNGVAERLTGWTQAEAAGRPLPEVFRIVHEESRDPVANPLERALSKGTIAGLATHTVLIARDGTERPIDDRAAPLRSDSGAEIGVALFFRDVSEHKRALLALRESDERHRKLADNLPSGFIYQIVDDGQGRKFTYVSAGVKDLCGVTPEQVQADPTCMYRLILEEDQPRVQAAEEEAGRTGKPFDCQFRTRTSTDVRWLHCRSARRQASDGRIVWDGIAIDVTERRRAEEELSASRDQLEIILKGVADGITVQDASGQLLFANDGAARMTGFPSAEAMVGTPLAEIVRRFELMDESGRPIPLAELPGRRALAGEPAPEAVVKFHILATGEQRWSLVRATPVRDSQGVAQFAINIFHDITDRKRAEEAQQFLANIGSVLAGSLDFQTTLVSVARLCVPRLADWCAVDVVEPGGILQRLAVAHADPEKVRWAYEIHHRYPPDPEAPHGIYQVLRTGQAELYSEIRDEQLVEAAHDPDYLRILRELGMTSVMIVPLRARGRTLGVLSLIAAESRRRFGAEELVLAEEVGRRSGLAADNARLFGEVVAADRRKDDFIALLAHELRNPLAPLRNGLEMMNLAPNDRSLVAEARAMMERQLGHMVRLIDDLLDISRVKQNKMALRRTTVLLADVISNAVETARPSIDAAGHKLMISMPHAPVAIDGDLTRLAQVFSNLLTNSAKYTERGGRIWLTAERQGDNIVVSVRDTGIGIPPESLPRIFDMFSQADRTIERSTGGLGIGLALVKGLVEMHDGAVSAQSDGQDKGSTFTVRLPVLDRNPADPAVTATASRIGGGPQRRILVVDDNVDSADSLARLLKLRGDEVLTAYDGPSALQTAESFSPDVVLLDIGLPGMDGYEIARRLRRLPAAQYAVLIAQTGWGQQDDRRRSHEAGFNHHLVKPVDPTVLQKLLDALPRR